MLLNRNTLYRAVGLAVVPMLLAWALLAQAPGEGWQINVSEPHSFTTAQIECADFYSTGFYRHVLYQIGAENGLLIPEQSAGDVIYLNHAAGLRAGDEVRLMRFPARANLTDQFPGQSAYLAGMGRLYAMVARARVLQVNGNDVATARLEVSCRPSQIGDFAIPWYPRANPQLDRVETINLLQPIAGPLKIVAAGREMASELGDGDEIFLSGRGAPAQVGQHWLIFRRRSSPSEAVYRRAVMGIYGLTYAPGVNVNQLSNQPHPAEIIGEAVVVSQQLGSSAALITYTRDRILPGDEAMPKR